jgi:hypothetical protein
MVAPAHSAGLLFAFVRANHVFWLKRAGSHLMISSDPVCTYKLIRAANRAATLRLYVHRAALEVAGSARPAPFDSLHVQSVR